MLEGSVINGVIVLDGNDSLPEGTRVSVECVQPTNTSPTLIGLLNLAGTLNDFPPDFALEHDHYIHGTPRRFSEKSE